MSFLKLAATDARGHGRLGEIGLDHGCEPRELGVDAVIVLRVEDHKVERLLAAVAVSDTPFDGEALIRSNLKARSEQNRDEMRGPKTR